MAPPKVTVNGTSDLHCRLERCDVTFDPYGPDFTDGSLEADEGTPFVLHRSHARPVKFGGEQRRSRKLSVNRFDMAYSRS